MLSILFIYFFRIFPKGEMMKLSKAYHDGHIYSYVRSAHHVIREQYQ